ncbi:hypothetical protein DPMN_163593 [Dreissena polymorpha]|uniref:Uncharacterized protein n=1 Tax=Dreissena polymorpha TaxID=45954 RepID=A0A9D4ESH0_DREPO|nr:hypothetical protein DPMN_163593 [Dreissena polymorpha]
MDSCAGLHGETDKNVWDPGGKEKLGFIDPSTENNFRLGFICRKELDFGGTQSKVWDPGGNEEGKVGFIDPSSENKGNHWGLLVPASYSNNKGSI